MSLLTGKDINNVMKKTSPSYVGVILRIINSNFITNCILITLAESKF